MLLEALSPRFVVDPFSRQLQASIAVDHRPCPTNRPQTAAHLREGEGSAVYVSGDQRATAERLLQLGVAPERVAGDSCSRTTWENATLTSAWLPPPRLQSQRLA